MIEKPVNKPQQPRSQKTMLRMLEAAEELLESKSWQALTIQDVVQTAGCSVGAFYGRFKDKDGLLHALDERYFAALIELIETAVSEPKWGELTLAETIEQLATIIVTMHQTKQGVLRTLILQARLEDDPRFRQREARLTQFVPQVMQLILAHRAEIKHNDVETAVQFGLMQMFYTAREMLIWPHIAQAMPYQGDALVQALARGFVGYLQG